jgi:hypothetical protein
LPSKNKSQVFANQKLHRETVELFYVTGPFHACKLIPNGKQASDKTPDFERAFSFPAPVVYCGKKG